MMNKKNLTVKLTEEDLREILSFYDAYVFGTNGVKRFTLIEGGLANTNFKLEMNNSKFFLLKICEEKSLEQLKVQALALNFLKLHGYFTAFPVKLKNLKSSNEEFVLEFKSISNPSHPWRIIIYDFLEGSPKALSDITASIMKDVASSVAQYHRIPSPPFEMSSFSMGLAEMFPFLLEMESNVKWNNHPFVRFLREEVMRLRPMIENSEIPRGILHGDLYPDNCLFTGEKLMAIIDWEEISFGALLIDVAMTICGFCYSTNNKLDYRLVNAFLSSYCSIRALTSRERILLPFFVDYCILSIAFWRFRQFNIRSFDETLCNKYVEMVERLKGNDWNDISLLF